VSGRGVRGLFRRGPRCSANAGGGRKWALIADFVLGRGRLGPGCTVATWTTRAISSAGAPVLDLTQSAAWIALGVIGVASVALCVARTPS